MSDSTAAKIAVVALLLLVVLVVVLGICGGSVHLAGLEGGG